MIAYKYYGVAYELKKMRETKNGFIMRRILDWLHHNAKSSGGHCKGSTEPPEVWDGRTRPAGSEAEQHEMIAHPRCHLEVEGGRGKRLSFTKGEEESWSALYSWLTLHPGY